MFTPKLDRCSEWPEMALLKCHDCLLLQYFTKMMPDITDQQSQSALVLLGMIATTEPSVIISNVSTKVLFIICTDTIQNVA